MHIAQYMLLTSFLAFILISWCSLLALLQEEGALPYCCSMASFYCLFVACCTAHIFRV